MRFRPALLAFALAAPVILAPAVARAGSSPPRMVVHISSYTQFGPSQLTASGSRVFFAMDDGPSNTHGAEPWVSDGTPAGTHMIADVVPGTDGSTPSCFVDVNGTVFFDVSRGMSPDNTYELWKTDGTAAGTTRVGDLAPTDRAYDRAARGKTLFLDARPAGSYEYELWSTDGVTTTKVVDLVPGAEGSTPTDVYVRSNRVYFLANAPGTPFSLYVTDGTAAGTVALADHPDWNGWADAFEEMGGYVYFARGDYKAYELWRTDGTKAGTTAVKTAFESYYGPDNMHALPNGKMIFRVDDVAHGGEPWVTDGTGSGTVLLADVKAGSEGSWDTFGHGVVFGGKLVFPADDGTHGLELWETDGTAAGTRLFADLAAGATGSKPNGLVVAGGRIVFAATDEAHGTELWESDGTAAGTHLVMDIAAGAASSKPSELTVVGGSVYFVAEQTAGDPQLWVYDVGPAPPTGAGDAGADASPTPDGGPGSNGGASGAGGNGTSGGADGDTAAPGGSPDGGCACRAGASTSDARSEAATAASLLVVAGALLRKRRRWA